MTHICVRKLTIIGSDDGLWPGRRLAIIWTNAGILLIGPLGTNLSKILIVSYTFSFKQGKSEGFDSCDRPSNLKLDSNRQFFRPCDREIWWMTLQNNRAPLLCYFKLCASFPTHWWIQTSSCSPETLNSGQNRQYFLAVWPKNFTDDPQK